MASMARPPFNTADPADLCVQAAKDICVILEIYSDYIQRLPCDLIFCIFTAAGTLLHHLRQSHIIDSAETRRHLRLCIYWLSVFGKNWKNAGERQKLLNECTHHLLQIRMALIIPTGYDWPTSLAPSKDTVPPSIIQPQLQPQPQQQLQPTLAYSTSQSLTPNLERHYLGDEGQFADILTTVEDWGFLNDFGDATDNFYAMDAEFRSVLERQMIDSEQGRGNLGATE